MKIRGVQLNGICIKFFFYLDFQKNKIDKFSPFDIKLAVISGKPNRRILLIGHRVICKSYAGYFKFAIIGFFIQLFINLLHP